MVGKTKNLVTSPVGCNFTSENPSVATVTKNGQVRGISAGSTRIVVEMDGYHTLYIPVEVVALPVLTVTPTSITVQEGTQIEIEVRVDGVPISITDVTLSVDDPDVVIIEPLTNEIMAGVAGNAVITVEYANAIPVTVDVTVTV